MGGANLADVAEAMQQWPTPTQDSAIERANKYKQGGTPLPVAVRMWPTPMTTDAKHGGGPWAYRRNTMPLNAAVLRIPTPTAGDAKSSGSRNSPTCNAHPGTSLTDYVREDGGTGRQDAPPDPPKLNPEWVELLMGWPRGWTQVDGYTPPRGKRAGKTTARASSPENPPTAQTD